MNHRSDSQPTEAEIRIGSHEHPRLTRLLLLGENGSGKATLVEQLLARANAGKLGAGEAAHQFFSIDEHRFRLASASVQERDPRALVAGVSSADCIVLVIDASAGPLPRVQDPGFLLAILGWNHVTLVVTKMDRVDYEEGSFRRISERCQLLMKHLGVTGVTAVPVSAVDGENLGDVSLKMPWYQGLAFLDQLKQISSASNDPHGPLRIAVRQVEASDTPSHDVRGSILSGTVRPGDPVRLLPSGTVTAIRRVCVRGRDISQAVRGEELEVALADEIDVSKVQVIAAADAPLSVADQFETRLLWIADKPMVSGRQYEIELGTARALCTPSKPKYRLDVSTLAHVAAKELEPGEVGVCNIAVDRLVGFEPYRESRQLSRFVLLDRATGDPVAMGLIHFALRRSTNVHMQTLSVDPESRAAIKGHSPCVLWFTGLSSSGKSTISNLVEYQLNLRGCHTVLLDGDNVRHGLNKNLGFTEADRAENIRRIAEVAKLMTDAGLITLVSFISPFAAERRTARDLIGDDCFLEIFVDAPLEVAEQRDIKGLYKKARAGEIRNFTGIGSPYEAPEAADLHLETASASAEASARTVIQLLETRGLIK